MPRATSVQEVLEMIPSRFMPEKAGDLKAVIQFDLNGDGGGQHYLSIADQACTVQSGLSPNPSMTLSASAADFLSLMNGELNAMQAFMQGKIRVKGDVSLAMKMQAIFGIGAP